MLILPRQAQDKHTEKSRKEGRCFLQEKIVDWLHYLQQRGLAGVDVWTPDDPQNTPSWMFKAFKGFLAGL
jgi:hypothetical protein